MKSIRDIPKEISDNLTSEQKQIFKKSFNEGLEIGKKLEYGSFLLEKTAMEFAVKKTFEYVEAPYTKDNYPNFKLKFDGLETIEKNYSQTFQDLFVLYVLKGKRDGFYIEVGGGKPFHGNNTALLKEFGWDGVTFEIMNLYFRKYIS